MNVLVNLVSKCEDLLGVEKVSPQCKLEFIRDDRVMELTSTYIQKLQKTQQQHDAESAAFAERIRHRANGSVTFPEHLDAMCQRFLAGIGMTFLNEIPLSVPRSERARVETLEIDWIAEPAIATWKEVHVQFPLRPVLTFCAEHSAGANREIRQVLVDQLISDIQSGIETVGGLALQFHDKSKSVFRLVPAVVTLEEDTATKEIEQSTGSYPSGNTGIVTVLEDWARMFHSVAASNLRLSENIQTLFEFDEMEEPKANDPVGKQLREIVGFFKNSEQQAQVINALSSAAYLGLLAAKATHDIARFRQRGRVLKAMKRVTAHESTSESSNSSSQASLTGSM